MISRAQRKDMLKKIIAAYMEELDNLTMIWGRCADASKEKYSAEDEWAEDMITATKDMLINALLLSSSAVTAISLQFYPDKKRGPLFKHTNNIERVMEIIDDIHRIYDERDQFKEEPKYCQNYSGWSDFEGDILNMIEEPKECRFAKEFYKRSKRLYHYHSYLIDWYFDVERINKRQAHAYLSEKELRELLMLVDKFKDVFAYGFSYLRVFKEWKEK